MARAARKHTVLYSRSIGLGAALPRTVHVSECHSGPCHKKPVDCPGRGRLGESRALAARDLKESALSGIQADSSLWPLRCAAVAGGEALTTSHNLPRPFAPFCVQTQRADVVSLDELVFWTQRSLQASGAKREP